MGIFTKTPFVDQEGIPATKFRNVLDKIIIVTDSQFQTSLAKTIGYSLPGTQYAGDLSYEFGAAQKNVPNATVVEGLEVASNTPGLSHPVGGRWAADCRDTTHRFEFADGTPPSNDFENSQYMKQFIGEIISLNFSALLQAYTGTPEWLLSPFLEDPYVEGSEYVSQTGNLVLTEHLESFVNTLGFAFGKITTTGKIRIRYKKTSPTTIQVDQVEMIGRFDRGKVFYTRVHFNALKSWNEQYTSP